LAKKTALDKDLKKIVRLETATRQTARQWGSLGLAFLFLVAVWAVTLAITGRAEGAIFIVIAAVIGGYMAINIGANDVANNMGPAVGSRALTMAGALAIAAIFEAAGATALGLPVSSTHIAVGAVFGVGFLREFYANNGIGPQKKKKKKTEESSEALEAALEMAPLSAPAEGADYPAIRETLAALDEAKKLKKARKAEKRKLVRRRHLLTIVGAWIITVLAAATLAGVLFLLSQLVQ
jgi:phosphate/sulfate permease